MQVFHLLITIASGDPLGYIESTWRFWAWSNGNGFLHLEGFLLRLHLLVLIFCTESQWAQMITSNKLGYMQPLICLTNRFMFYIGSCPGLSKLGNYEIAGGNYMHFAIQKFSCHIFSQTDYTWLIKSMPRGAHTLFSTILHFPFI